MSEKNFVAYGDAETLFTGIGNKIRKKSEQVSEMPVATSSIEGKVVQYIGATNQDYIHGYFYECKNVGGVYQWVNIPVGNDPVEITSTDPYTCRQGKGNLADMEIVGASVGWNQLVQNGNFASTSNWQATNCSLSASNNILTITDNGGDSYVRQQLTGVGGHKYFVTMSTKQDESGTMTVNAYGRSIGTSTAVGSFITFSKIIEKATTGTSNVTFDPSGKSAGNTMYIMNAMIIDLTLLFGSTIADAIYAMEQATAGAGVAFFRKYFSEDYYAYDAGSIQSVSIASRKVVGKNQWNEQTESGYYNQTGKASGSGWKRSDDYIKVVGGQTYTLSGEVVTSGNYTSNGIAYYTSDGEYISVDTYNITTKTFSKTFTTPSNCGKIGIYVRSSVDFVTAQLELGTTATPYEPYTSTAYPFDSTKQLRGMFDLVNGELKANGDIYSADGNIQRKYGIVDLGTLDWSINSDNMFTTPRTSFNGKSYGLGVCAKYVYRNTLEAELLDKQFWIRTNNLIINDTNYSDAATFKTAMSGVYLVYEFATPATESAQPYQNPQRAYIDGTEEFTDGLTRDVMIPVGNNTTYQQDKILPSVEDYVDSITDTKADISSIATEENGATASKAYTTGQHFYKDGKFCTAIANIASNAAFTLNTNYVEGTIAEAIESIQNNSGHTIVNSNGSSMTARSKLKFANATVTDDPANDQTVITTNPASAEQTATLATANFIKDSSDSGVYYITRSGFCEVHINTIKAKNAGQGLLVATGLPLGAFDGIIMGNTPNFEDGTAFYINTTNNTTSLYALIPDTGVKSGCVLYMMK